jgi:hypothetical protein
VSAFEAQGYRPDAVQGDVTEAQAREGGVQ